MPSAVDLLIQACQDGDVDAARKLLANGLDANVCKVANGRTALIAASGANQVEVARFLLDEVGVDVDAVDEHGMTALCWAGSGEMASLLVSKGATVNPSPESREEQIHKSPLFRAAELWHEDVASVLLKAGARVDATSRFGSRPIHAALERFFLFGDENRSAVRIIEDLFRYGATWDQECRRIVFDEDANDPETDEGRRWQRVGPAIEYAARLWMCDHRQRRLLTLIPEEVIESGLEATRTFVDELRASDQIVCRRAICLVGPSTAGKTSLIKSLIEKAVCLEHIDDRTIGIDHFMLRFDDPDQAAAATVPRTHEVRFSDFAGQDVYQVMHSLFFTRRTLFLLCVDLNAYSIALLKCEMLTQDDAKLQHMMNEYVDHTVMSWIRIIFSRQPDAEFVFVYTKKDTIAEGPGVDEREVLAHVKMMLGRVVAILADMKDQSRKSQVSRPPDADELDTLPLTHLWDDRLETYHKPTFEVITSCSTTESSIRDVWTTVERLILAQSRSYAMPEKYLHVLEAVIRRREAAEGLPIHRKIQATFIDVNILVAELMDEVPGLDDKNAAKNILRSLRDCVDILWYEDMEDAMLQTTVILDPMLLIEFLRQVINHKHPSGAIDHATLSGLPYWNHLTGNTDRMASMKLLLQTFRLVHPASGEMAFDSDLIVPMYWKTNPHSLWVFGGERLRLNARGYDDENVSCRVHWEFRFTQFIPDTFFDHFIVASYSPDQAIQVGPDWILYRDEQDPELAACRVVVSRHWKTHERSLHLEAVLANNSKIKDTHEKNLWEIFTRVCEALGKILTEHRGLSVTRFAHTEDDKRMPSLSSLLHAINKQQMAKKMWMPPHAEALKCLRWLAGKRTERRPSSTVGIC